MALTTTFYPQKEVQPFWEILKKRLSERGIEMNTFINAIIPPICAELSKDKSKSPIVVLDLGVIDLSK